MRKVKGICSLLLLLVLGLGILGCGGGGGINDSPFTGNFFGTWNNGFAPNYGTSQISISNLGGITGTTHDSHTNTDGAITGHVSSDGTFTLTTTFQGSTAQTRTGTFSWSNVHHLVGTDNLSYNYDLMAQ